MANYFKLTVLIFVVALSSCYQLNGQISLDGVDTSTYKNIPALVPYREGKLWGFSNAEGKLIIPARFYYALMLSDSLFAGYNINGDNKTYLYNASAQLIGTYDQQVKYFQLGKNKTYPYINDKLFLFFKYDQSKVVDGYTYYSGNYKFYIYNKTGHFHFDSTGYVIEEFLSRKDVMAIGKPIDGTIKWGLLDTTGQLIEPMRYKKFYPSEYSDKYIKAKDSAGKIYAALSQSEQYYQWPKEVYEKISEQIAEGYFFIQYYVTDKQVLFKYTGDTISRASKFDKYSNLGNAYFVAYRYVNGKEKAALIDSAGNELLPNKYDGIFGYRLMPWALIRTENDYTGLYDYSLHKMLIEPSAGYMNIERVSNHWVSVTTKDWVKKILNPETGESYIIKSPENFVAKRDNGAYLYTANNKEILDLERGKRLAVRLQYDHGKLICNVKNEKLGAFNMDSWQQVVPAIYDSISIEYVQDGFYQQSSAIVAISKGVTDIYTTTGRKIFSADKNIKVATGLI